MKSSQFCAGHPGSTGIRVNPGLPRVDPVRRIIPGRAGLGRVNPVSLLCMFFCHFDRASPGSCQCRREADWDYRC